MANFTRSPFASAVLGVIWLLLVEIYPSPAFAAGSTLVNDCTECTPTPTPTPTPTYAPTPTPTPTPSPSPSASPSPTPTPTGSDSSGGSINDLAKQRFNQMITNRVLGSVLLGVNEQVNCSDCVSAFGSAGSFSAGIHGRKSLTANLSLLAALAHTQYSEGGYSVTRPPNCA